MTIRLGPFELHAPLGKGGMGVVWRGVHRLQDIPVAVKVITEKIARDEHYLKAFRKETAAVARLDHPGVVWLFDAGQVSRRAARDSYGQLVEGSPYLAMELADRGTLSTLEVRTWAELHDVAEQLLHALAHAHARGVIHRDLKPANVLRFQHEQRERFKLSDFGISHALDATETATHDAVLGTLHYMSPEQIRAEWREYGPWTDLYALGNLLWKLATGQVPFHGRVHADLLQAQLHQLPTGFRPRFPVPPGLSAWLVALMHKEPALRFHCAADALYSLHRIAREPTPPPDRGGDEEPTESMPVSRVEVSRSGSPRPAPMPRDWRSGPTAERPHAVLGAGRGLFGLRTIPLVGRDAERDQLWAALNRVHDERASRVVVVRGEVGVGKTRLADWLAERAHESGAALVLRCRCSPSEHPELALRSMLTRWARAGHIDREAREARVAAALRLGDVNDPILVERIGEILVDDEPIDAESRHEELVALVSALGRSRPVLLVIDDAQWGMDPLRLALRLVAANDTRALVVLAVGDELLADRTVEPVLLEELLARPRVEVLEVAPLPPGHRDQLVEGVLGLAPELARRVAGRSRGNPLFAVQLIATLVVHDLLLPGSAGFQIRVPPPDAPLEIKRAADFPANLGQLWRERLDRLFEDLPAEARPALERAAAFGLSVPLDAWQQICDDPGGAWAASEQVMFVPENARVRHQLLDRLVAERLAEETTHGWSFAHGQVRDLLERLAREAGRLEEHHAACATWLQRQPDPHHTETLGLHLLAAGRTDAAVGLLLGAARLRARHVGNRAALGLLVVVETAMIEREVQKSDPRWGRVWLERSALYARLGNAEEALRWARRAEAGAAVYGWPDQVGAAAIAAGAALLVDDRLTEARHELARGLAVLGGDPGAAVGHAWSAVAAARLGLRDDATAHAREAEATLGGEPEPALAVAWDEIARSALSARDAAAAQSGFERSGRVWAQLGNRIASRAAAAAAAAVAEAR